MPALDDDREERLAQELAKGRSQAVAYVNAGYLAKNSRVAASASNRLLKQKPYINDRVEELYSIARDAQQTAVFTADLAGMTRLFLEDRDFARQAGQAGAAVSASSAIAKLYRLGGDNPPGSRDNPLVAVTRIELVAPQNVDTQD